MASIVLAHTGTFVGFTINYNSTFPLPSGDTGGQMSLSCLKYIPFKNTEVATGKLLNGRSYEHIVSKKNKYEVVISADELMTPTKKTFLEAFWQATHKYICIDTTAGKYIPVIIGGGDIPFEYIEDSKYLPEFSIILEEV